MIKAPETHTPQGFNLHGLRGILEFEYNGVVLHEHYFGNLTQGG